uniref:Translation factor GUF1 homolog, mitochondrial n=1 Tax=Phallusia mammillata TaxID=59560 RepID=A0A6F9DDI7_9ASCI|nr:translation factor Guf1, mitochondrial-like [Phallusia mammillata]
MFISLLKISVYFRLGTVFFLMAVRLKSVFICKSCFLRNIVQIRLLSTSALRVIRSKVSDIDLTAFTPDKIRNFGIIAHVDHGKSTLADRLLEITGTIHKSEENKQVMDSLQVERERGITVKAQTASIIHKHDGDQYLLNFVDTPGHVDFSYEVSRSLAACQGVLLLVDATQGVQAQTLANFYLAMEHNLKVIPVINKIDLKTANIDRVYEEMTSLFGIDLEDVIAISAKNGSNIEEVLKTIVCKLPSPLQRDPKSFNPNNNLKVLLFDSLFEMHRGVTAYVAIIDGVLRTGDTVTSQILLNREQKGKKTYTVQEVGMLRPGREKTDALYPGQVGYFICNMKSVSEAQIGDTLFREGFPVKPLPGFVKALPVVYAGLFPPLPVEYDQLRSAIDKLILNDRSVTVKHTDSPVLGRGFLIGYLGLLHMDIFRQRLRQEFQADTIVTVPNVTYKAILKPSRKKGIKEPKEILITKASEFPDAVDVIQYSQPMVTVTIVTPVDYITAVMDFCDNRTGEEISNTKISETQVVLVYRMPSSEVLIDNFYDGLKSLSSGYASFDYEESGYEVTNLKKIDIIVNGVEVEELSRVCTSDKVDGLGRSICQKLKTNLPGQLYPISIQAAVGKTVFARETRPAMKKDVLAKCYGGDYSRKLKLLKRHSEKVKALKQSGSANISRKVFIEIFKR